MAGVGFGESFLEPLRLEFGRQQADPAGTFRLVQLGERLQLEKSEPNASWKPQYSFALHPRSLADFARMCHYHQTSPESHFTQNRVCSRATLDGRITLADMKLIVTRNGQREEIVLSSEGEWNNAIQEHFGIHLSPWP